MKRQALLGLLPLAVACATLTGTQLTHADTLAMPEQSEWSAKTPARGTTKAYVEAEFGAPDSEEGPRGRPPIYFWEYPDFTVYFEDNHVIHTVIKRR
ncbi:MAG: hypothetical protein ACI9Y1_002042 [Lentisphaeria bacterium]|jgi:hypothetical protein